MLEMQFLMATPPADLRVFLPRAVAAWRALLRVDRERRQESLTLALSHAALSLQWDSTWAVCSWRWR